MVRGSAKKALAGEPSGEKSIQALLDAVDDSFRCRRAKWTSRS
jgi:translation elongation factor EF-Tu-like GTPase